MAKGLLGIDKVMANLNKEITLMKKASLKGLIEASIVIRRDMDQRPPLIPVNLGNLRASWFTTVGSRVPEAGGQWRSTDKDGNPVDVGKLSSDHASAVSGATAKASANPFPILIMGFSAGYGVFVHEAGFKKGNRPGSGPKFFESAINRNHKVVLEIIANDIRNRI